MFLSRLKDKNEHAVQEIGAISSLRRIESACKKEPDDLARKPYWRVEEKLPSPSASLVLNALCRTFSAPVPPVRR